MAVSEGPQAEGGAPGLPELGVRLLLGAVLVIAVLLSVQRCGAGDRAQRESFALVDGTIRIADLSAPIEVLRDARGIPHLIARSEADAWFGLGFAHAQDRLAQMLWLRRRAQGRTAEIEGVDSLPVDRLARLLEIERTSKRVVGTLPESTRAVLEAYSAGVNARIARIQQGRAIPPRMLAGGVEAIEPWRPSDSLALGKLLSWCMGGTLETTLVLDDLIQRLDSVPARPFFPGRSSIDFGVSPDLDRERPDDRSVRTRGGTEGATRALCRGIGLPTGDVWVLGSRLSASGAPVVVANWHVEPAVPALFYQAHLAADGLEVAGATMPGSPVFWMGRNRNFAWAGVPASAPVADLFIETLREDRGLYQNGTLWVALQEREEILLYRDARGVQEETMRIRSTRHGPLIEALNEPKLRAGDKAAKLDPARSARALSWTGARDGDGLTSMLSLLRLGDAGGLEAALALHHEPVLAIAYADRTGRGGVQVAGWLPKRPLPTGLVPVQGRLRSFDWRERVPLDELPAEQLRGDGTGWVMAADQPWPVRGGLDQIEWLWRPGDRAARLEVELARRTAEGPLDLRAAADLLDDDVAHRATRAVTAILGLARRAGPLSVEAQEVAALLERWDGRMDSDSAGAAAYHLVIEHLLENLLRAPFGSALFERYLDAPHVRPQFAIERLVLRAAILRRAGGWTDEERVAKASRASLRQTWVSLNHRLGPTRERWSWGGLHRLRFAAVGPTNEAAVGFERDLPMHGSGQTLSFARHRPGRSFEVSRAGLYRTAMDLAASDRLLSALAPGQSEHPGHPHFADGVGRGGVSRLSLFATSRLVIEEEGAQRLILEPAP